jgi:hypothetical protein
MGLTNSTSNHGVAQTREQVKQEHTANEQPNTLAENRKLIRVRLIPIWLRIVITAILIAASLLSGVIVGYGIIGDGKPSDALKKSTWNHISDLVNKEK